MRRIFCPLSGSISSNSCHAIIVRSWKSKPTWPLLLPPWMWRIFPSESLGRPLRIQILSCFLHALEIQRALFRSNNYAASRSSPRQYHYQWSADEALVLWKTLHAVLFCSLPEKTYILVNELPSGTLSFPVPFYVSFDSPRWFWHSDILCILLDVSCSLAVTQNKHS